MTEPHANSDPRRAVVAWLGSEHIVAEIKRALPDHIPVDWFMRLAQTSILMNPDLATSDRPSLLRELVAVAQLGLVLDPQMGEAWLIIDRHKNVQRRIGYQGLRKLALQSGLVTGLNSQAVYDNDQADIELGDTPHVRHKVDVRKDDRGKLLGCYAVGRVTGTDQPVVEWMSWKQIQAHRDRYSQAKSGPWSDPLAEIEMGRKTVFRRLCKWLPKSPLLADALAEEDRLDMRVVNPDVTPPEPQAQSKLSLIEARNAPREATGAGPINRESPEPADTRTSRPAPSPIPETAPGRPMGSPHARQETEPVSASPEPEPPTENASAGQQSASDFLASIGGEIYRRPEDAALALILLVEQSTAPGMILDEYAEVMDALPAKLANEVLAAVSKVNNVRERKSADAARERQASAQTEPKRRGRPPGSKNRPPEPAGNARSQPPPFTAEIMNRIKTATSKEQLEIEVQRAEAVGMNDQQRMWISEAAVYRRNELDEARSQEPAATPAPGREDVGAPDWPSDDTPGWVTEETEAHTEPGERYDLRDELGKVIIAGQPPSRFLEDYRDLLANTPDPENVRRLRYHNNRALERLIQNETDNALAEQAVSLRP